MKKVLALGLSVIALGLAAGVGIAQITVPQVQSIGSTDLIQVIVAGQPTVQSTYASALLVGNYGSTLGGNNPENALIGGDATTNLFQRATTGSSVTTTVTYGGPDRWAYWSGTSTAMTVSRDSTAADLPTTGYKYAFKMARTSGQTGVVQVCMMQEVESANAYQFQGQTAELDFHAVTGATFSPASGNIQAYIITGTGVDEGVAGSASGAFGLNAGGGGSGGWTGQVNWAATIAAGVGTNARYTIAAPIPAGATEIGVAICFTPVGTAGANDYVALSGIQLTRNSALTSLVAANASGTATALNVNDARAKGFSRRSQASETVLQQRYFYSITETATITPRAFCHVTSANSVMQCGINFPVPMRIAPTATYAAGFAGFTTTAETTATNCSALAIDDTVVFVNSTQFAIAKCTLTSSTIAVGLSMTLVDNSGSGSMKYNSDL